MIMNDRHPTAVPIACASRSGCSGTGAALAHGLVILMSDASASGNRGELTILRGTAHRDLLQPCRMAAAGARPASARAMRRKAGPGSLSRRWGCAHSARKAARRPHERAGRSHCGDQRVVRARVRRADGAHRRAGTRPRLATAADALTRNLSGMQREWRRTEQGRALHEPSPLWPANMKSGWLLRSSWTGCAQRSKGSANGRVRRFSKPKPRASGGNGPKPR